MARPLKRGLEYFPLDVALDKKFELIEAEFGLNGFGVVVKLLQEIYGRQGYYVEWTNEVALLFSRKVGLGVNVVSEIVTASIKRGIFNQTLFDKYQILTSKGIQERYFEAISRRKNIEVEKQYLLVNVASHQVNVINNPVNVNINSENNNDNPQSKVKKSKGKKSREYIGGKPSRNHTPFVPPSIDDIKAYCEERGNGVDAKRFYDYYSAADWVDAHGNSVRNWKQKMIANWENNISRNRVPSGNASTNPFLREDI